MPKGGKREGAGRKKAPHTLQAEAYKAYLIQEVMKEAAPIVAALIKRARLGDVQAIKEIHERTMGKVKESVDLNGNLNHTFDDIPDAAYKAIIERESRRIKVSGE